MSLFIGIVIDKIDEKMVTYFYILKNKLTICLMIMSFIIPSVTFASVTMIGNRIIYASQNSSVNVEFNNNDAIPYAVQSWLDDGDEASTPTSAVAPFYISPSLFKIQPHGGQVLRVTYVGKDTLPKDRESLFYFNFLQIPPSNSGENITDSKNKMLVLLKNRVKLFYRPKEISKKINEIKDNIKVSSFGNLVLIKNQSPFYISILDVKLKQGNETYTEKSDMLSPFSEGRVKFKTNKSIKNAKLILDFINDQGAKVSHEYEIHP